MGIIYETKPIDKDDKKKLHDCPCPFCGKKPEEWIDIFYQELTKWDKKKKDAYKIGTVMRRINKKTLRDVNFQPPTKEEFDRMLMVALNTPPRKRTKKDRT